MGRTLEAVGSFLLTPLISAHYGWEHVFSLFGLLGILWAVVWFATVHEHPPAVRVVVDLPTSDDRDTPEDVQLKVLSVDSSTEARVNGNNTHPHALLLNTPIISNGGSTVSSPEPSPEALHLSHGGLIARGTHSNEPREAITTSMHVLPLRSSSLYHHDLPSLHDPSPSTTSAIAGVEVDPSTAVAPPLGFWPVVRLVVRVLSTPALLVICLSNFSYGLAHYVTLMWLPSYFREHFGSSSSTSMLTTLPYALMFVSNNLSGILVDEMIIPRLGGSGNKDALLRIRKWMACLGFGGMALALVAFDSFNAPTDAPTATVAMCIALTTSTIALGGFDANTLEVVSARHAGLFMAVSNSVATLGGVIGVPVSTFLLQHPEYGKWHAIWFLIAAVQVGAATLFATFATTKVVLT